MKNEKEKCHYFTIHIKIKTTSGNSDFTCFSAIYTSSDNTNFLSLRTSCTGIPGLSVLPSDVKEKADISHFQTEPEE